jgi:hypothetical protein
MLDRNNALVNTSRAVVGIALVLNRMFFAGVICLLVFSMVWPGTFAGAMIRPTPGRDVASAVIGMRWLMLIGISEAVGTEILLRALREIIASAGAGDPFVAVNARRLRTIGWALLGLQLLDFPGALIGRCYPSLGPAAPDVTFSPGGWIAVLMVFVLSRVFAAGSAMKDDLEGTV